VSTFVSTLRKFVESLRFIGQGDAPDRAPWTKYGRGQHARCAQKNGAAEVITGQRLTIPKLDISSDESVAVAAVFLTGAVHGFLTDNKPKNDPETSQAAQMISSASTEHAQQGNARSNAST
jgi:hypothetical protein